MSDFWDKSSVACGIALGGSGATVGLLSLDETSAESGLGGLGNSLDELSSSSEDISCSTPDLTSLVFAGADGPIETTGAAIALGGAAAIAGVVSFSLPITTNQPIAQGKVNGKDTAVHEDSSGNINMHDATPYCRVEKNAARTYDVLHGQKDRDYKFPAAVMETKDAMDAFNDVFGAAPSPRKLRETLDTLERVLEKQADERGS